MADDNLLTDCEELSILPVGLELSWRWAPFLARAEKFCYEHNLPHWKIHSIARTLQLNFMREVTVGLSEVDALQKIEKEISVAYGK